MTPTTLPPHTSYTPDYWEGFPQMPKEGHASETDFELGWLSGLYKTALKSLDQLFGSYNISTEDVDFGDRFLTGGAVGYIIVWFVTSIIFSIFGLVWCCCNKCCCCCQSSYTAKTAAAVQNNPAIGRRASRRSVNIQRDVQKETHTGAIVLTVFMAIWLIGFLLIISFTFAGNEELKKVTDNLLQEVDFNNSIEDVLTYLDTTSTQLNFTLDTDFERFQEATDTIWGFCEDKSPADACGIIQRNLERAIEKSKSELKVRTKDLTRALADFRRQLDLGRKRIQNNDQYKKAKEIMKGDGLYGFMMFFNLLYCLIFALVLLGTLLAVCASTPSLKTKGYLTIRVGIFFMFLFAFMIIYQMIAMFAFGGIIVQVICPILRNQEDLGDIPTVEENMSDSQSQCNSTGSEFIIPKYRDIMRNCKNHQSCYKSFNMRSAYDVRCLADLKSNYDGLLNPGTSSTLPPDALNSNPPPSVLPKINPNETASAIYYQIDRYTDFLIESVENEVGKCELVYNAVNSTITTLCYSLPAPMVSLWWILQFIPPLFLLITITALCLERKHC